MAAIFGALRRALPILLTPRIVALATLPLVVAALVFVAIGMAAWDPLTEWLARALGAGAESALWQRIAADAIAVLMFAALAVITAFTALAVLSMPVIVRVVATRDFPTLTPLRGGTVSGSIANAAVALVVYVPLWMLSLPLLFVPPLYAAVSLVLNAWLTQRMFRYDALAEHARREEIAAVLGRSRARLMGLGLVLSPLSLIPVVNILVLPIYAGIAFTELALAELVAFRASSAPRPA
ncbi:MAG: EI24 domain-containing protein [Betaproteobacteria bacterium]